MKFQALKFFIKLKNKLKKLGPTLFRIIFSVALLYLLLSHFGQELKKILPLLNKNLNIYFIILGILFVLLSQLTACYRWEIICKYLNICPEINKKFLLVLNPVLSKIYFTCFFCACFMPLSIGADLLRAYLLKKHSEKIPDHIANINISNINNISENKNNYSQETQDFSILNCTSSVILDRFSGVFIAVLFAILSVNFFHLTSHIPKSLFWTINGSFAFFILIFLLALVIGRNKTQSNSKILAKIQKYSNILKTIILDKKISLSLLGGSLLLQTFLILFLLFFSKAFGMNFKFYELTVMHAISVVSIIFLPSLNGLGVRDGVYSVLAESFGHQSAEGLVLSICWYLTYGLVSLIGLPLYFSRKN